MKITNKETDKQKPVILFADDDPLCLGVGKMMLQKLGYNVLTANDGKEAISIFKKNIGKVHLVILDMRMPQHGGITFCQLKKINAEVKVIIISGYTEDHLIREMMVQGCKGYLQKPFDLKVLSQKIRTAFDN